MRCKDLKRSVVFVLMFVWFLFGYSQVFHDQVFPWGVREVRANTVSLVSTSCEVGDVNDTGCYSAISADGGSSYALGKNGHIDAPFETLSATAVASATLYYDSWGSLTGTWSIEVQDARDGTPICSVSPAPEDGSETQNSVGCSVTTTQLNNGVWLFVQNSDDRSPESINLDYVYLYVDYTPAAAVSISLNTDGVVALGTLVLGTTQDTTASGVDDVETISIDAGPADLDVRSSNFTESGNTWTLAGSNEANQVKWDFSGNGSDWTVFTVFDTLYSLDTNVSQGQTRDLFLRLTMPTTTVSYLQYASTVTIVASAP